MVEGARRLKPARIEARATLLLLDYQWRFGIIKSPPVPVDEILEFLLKLHLEFADLRQDGFEGVVGITDTEARRVVIDERLDPLSYPNMEGRFNFTVAHEIGHFYLQHPAISSPTNNSHPSLVGSHQELEWQADKFASYLLMPKNMVLREWRAKFNHSDPLVITPEMERAALANGFSRSDFVRAFAEERAGELAPMFRVSVTAMRIRLQELGLLPRE